MMLFNDMSIFLKKKRKTIRKTARKPSEKHHKKKPSEKHLKKSHDGFHMFHASLERESPIG